MSIQPATEPWPGETSGTKEIRIGGVYPIDKSLIWKKLLEYQHANGFPDAIAGRLPHNGEFDSVIVTGYHEHSGFYSTVANHGLRGGLPWTHPDCLGDEIGFDPTQSPKFKELKQQMDEVLVMSDHLDAVKKYADELGVEYDTEDDKFILNRLDSANAYKCVRIARKQQELLKAMYGVIAKDEWEEK